MRYLSIISIALLASCGGAVVQDRPERASVLVPVGCVSGERPEPPMSLKEQWPNWDMLTHKQKTQLVSAQAGRHQNYAKALAAATGACR